MTDPVTGAVVAGASRVFDAAIGTAHKITIEVVGRQTIWQKVGWFLLGGTICGGVAYVKGRADESNDRFDRYTRDRDEKTGHSSHRQTHGGQD